MKKQQRRVRMYFDQNDEMVDEETAMCDQNNFYHKYHVVEVDFAACDEDDYENEYNLLEGLVATSKGSASSKIDKITKDTFYGEKPTENAEIFLNSLSKTRANHLKKVQDKELNFAASGILPCETVTRQ